MAHPFLGSPAFFFLLAATFHVVYIIIYYTCQPILLATACGLVICVFMVCICLLCYVVSLHTNEVFSRFRSYTGVGLAVPISLLLGALLAYLVPNGWDTWMFLLLGWGIALSVVFVVDLVFTGIHLFHLPVWRFMERIHY